MNTSECDASLIPVRLCPRQHVRVPSRVGMAAVSGRWASQLSKDRTFLKVGQASWLVACIGKRHQNSQPALGSSRTGWEQLVQPSKSSPLRRGELSTSLLWRLTRLVELSYREKGIVWPADLLDCKGKMSIECEVSRRPAGSKGCI